MSMLDILEKAVEEGSFIYHEFLIYYKSNAKTVYGIVEGKDDPIFYKGLIESNLPENWDVKLIFADGRRNALLAFSDFDWERFSSKRICFFVDRDLTDFIEQDFIEQKTVENHNVYTTDNYSIENDVVKFSTFQRVLEEVLNINDLKPDEINNLELLFNSQLSFFQDKMLPIMAQIILWRRKQQELLLKGNKLRILLNKINLDSLFGFKNGNIYLKDNFENESLMLEKIAEFVEYKSSSADELEDAKKEFLNKQGEKNLIRGKYILWFFVKFIVETHKYISITIPRFIKSPKYSVTFSESNAMIYISTRIRCPYTLQKFIEHNYILYIKENSVNQLTNS